MANFKRKSPRISSRRDRIPRATLQRIEDRGERYRWTKDEPGWFRIVCNVRPRRRLNKHLARAVLRGADPENTPWPLGNNRPHDYWW